MAITRVPMPRTDRGRKVPDKYACSYGHLHPSRAHAVKCHDREHLKQQRKATIGVWHVVSTEDGQILSVHGEALLAESQESARSKAAATGLPTYLHHVKGPRPAVGQSISMRGVHTGPIYFPRCERCGDSPLRTVVHDRQDDDRAGCVNCGHVPGDTTPAEAGFSEAPTPPAAPTRPHGRDLSGEELCEILDEFVNGCDKRKVDEFVAKLTLGTHRTLQQLIAGLFTKSFEAWAALPDSHFDLRNQATVELARKFVAATGDQYDRHLPLI